MEQVIISAKLLVIARDSTILQSIRSAARSNRWQLDVAASAWDALEKLHSGSSVDLLIVDLLNTEVDGFRILRWLRKIRPDVSMMLLDRIDDTGRRQEALQLGSCDYLVSSGSDFQIETAIRRNLPAVTSREVAELQFSVALGQYKSLRTLLQRVRQDTEKNAITFALEKTQWNRKAAARLLKISYRSILYKIDQYRMSPFDQRATHAQQQLEPVGEMHLEMQKMKVERVAGRSAEFSL